MNIYKFIKNSMARCFAFSAKYLLQDDSVDKAEEKYNTIRKQFIEDVKIALKDDEYVQQSYINYLDSLPSIEKKYEFLTDVYQHYFDYFVRDNHQK